VNIVVFGATGGTGLLFLRQAVDAGHRVTAFARNRAKLERVDGLESIVDGDAREPADVSRAVDGQDAVVSMLSSTTKVDPRSITHATQAITRAMAELGVRRLVATTAYGPIATKPLVIAPLVRRIFAGPFADAVAAENTIRATELDWTIVRATRLTNGPAREPRLLHEILTSGPYSISRAALARVALETIERTDLFRQAVNVSG
jgi:uncharacterized protein YbjT (DUF2867 family)